MPEVKQDITTQNAVLECLKSVPGKRWSTRRIEAWIKEHHGIGRTHNTIVKVIKFLRDEGPEQGYRIPPAARAEDDSGEHYVFWLENIISERPHRPIVEIMNQDWAYLNDYEKVMRCEHVANSMPEGHIERKKILLQAERYRKAAVA